MTTIEVNGRKYKVREFMTWAEWNACCDAGDEFGTRLLMENLYNSDGAKYESVEALQAALPVPDVKQIRQKIYSLNGLGDDDPLAEQSDSSDG